MMLAGLNSCVGDLNVTPIDPNVTLPEDVLNTEDAYAALLAKCYAGLTTSGSDGPDGGPDIDGIDGGFGQYMRALFYMNELTTDEALCVWNDKTVKDLHALSFTTSDIFVTFAEHPPHSSTAASITANTLLSFISTDTPFS